MNEEILISCGVGRTARPVPRAGETPAPQELYLHNWDAPSAANLSSRICPRFKEYLSNPKRNLAARLRLTKWWATEVPPRRLSRAGKSRRAGSLGQSANPDGRHYHGTPASFPAMA